VSKQKRKWYPPTPEQEWRQIQKDFDLQVLKDYAKAGDPKAIEALKKLTKDQ
jgi:hypothetical protein